MVSRGEGTGKRRNKERTNNLGDDAEGTEDGRVSSEESQLRV